MSFVPKPLSRTLTLSHEPVYADVTVKEALSAEHDAKEANETPAAVARQQAALKSIFGRMRGARAALPVAPAALPKPVLLSEFKSPLQCTESLRPGYEPSVRTNPTDPAILINASVSGLRRTDYDGRGPAPLLRAPSAMPACGHLCEGCGCSVGICPEGGDHPAGRGYLCEGCGLNVNVCPEGGDHPREYD